MDSGGFDSGGSDFGNLFDGNDLDRPMPFGKPKWKPLTPLQQLHDWVFVSLFYLITMLGWPPFVSDSEIRLENDCTLWGTIDPGIAVLLACFASIVYVAILAQGTFRFGIWKWSVYFLGMCIAFMSNTVPNPTTMERINIRFGDPDFIVREEKEPILRTVDGGVATERKDYVQWKFIDNPHGFSTERSQKIKGQYLYTAWRKGLFGCAWTTGPELRNGVQVTRPWPKASL